jgi:hypothetical protein
VALTGPNWQVRFGHGARHLQGTGLSRADVEAVIVTHVLRTVRAASTVGDGFWGRVHVHGWPVEYRAYHLGAGVIHVGTYYVGR